MPSKGFDRAQPILVMGCRGNRLNEPVFVAALLFRQTEHISIKFTRRVMYSTLLCDLG